MSQTIDSGNVPPATVEPYISKEKTNGSGGKPAMDSPEDRVLKRGDLARIIDRKPSKARLKNHVGSLGRVVRATPVEDNSSSHTFLYDIEFILGGKLGSVERSDLKYTTALAEGMIGDSKRKRKPNSVFVSSPEKKEEKPKKKTVPKKQKKAPAKKNTALKKTALKTLKKRAGSSSTSKVKSKKAKVSKAEPVAEEAPSTTVNLYERHRREFERSIGRLEKADPYHWFLGDLPPEFDETYIVTTDSTDQAQTEASSKEEMISTASSGGAPVKTPSPRSQSPLADSTDNKTAASTKTKKTTSDKEPELKFPDHPPYNFHILRKRMQHGRYVVDREVLEIEEHRKLMKPYLKSVGTRGSQRSKGGKRKSNLRVLHPKAVNWDLFRKDVIGMCDSAGVRNIECDDGSAGTISNTCKKIKDVLEQMFEKMGRRHDDEITNANNRNRFASAIESYDNAEAAMQGRWRREAFPYRKYERLKTDVVCAGLSELDGRIASYELKTSLKDSFLGLSYMYDDTEKSEAWMKSILNGAGEESEQQKVASALASDDGVIKAQVAGTMQSLLIAVQDRVMTDMKVLEQKELRNASWMIEAEKVPEDVPSASIGDSSSAPEIVEQPVWGIDCYTRRNISICLETEFDSDTVLTFIEKWLLPAINACPVDFAHDIANAARILEGLPFSTDTSLENNGTTTKQWETTLLGKALLNKISTSGPPWLAVAAHLLRKSFETLGSDFFRVHPKGHGSIVLCPKLEPNKLVTFYRGEVYPSWRWGEKMDAIASIQERKGLKPVLPDFFNMALERPMIDPRGYGLLFCDASRKSGYGSMLSHSCVPSCEVRVAAVNGELTLAMTTLREMTIGDELTFDYNAVTESLNEYQSAVCLCGHGRCRGSFLHFATADCYQQVLNRNSPVAVRLSNLIKGCMKKVMSEDDDIVLKLHGFQTAAFGAVSVNRRQAKKSTTADVQLDSMDFVPIWLRTYVADTLRYIEYERRALPIALVCNQLFTEDGKTKAGVPEPVTREAEESEDDDEKPIKGAKPEPTFFYYSRTQREHFVSLLMKEEGKGTLIGIELKREIQKLASSHWNPLGPQEKQKWKDKAMKGWVKNGGKEKARLEEERLARLSKSKNKTNGKKSPKKETSKSEKARGEGKKTSKIDEKPKQEAKTTFQAADAEGISAMEQRIQQLTQTLSRVGRVLDRHREEVLLQKRESLPDSTPETLDMSALQQLVHSPLCIMSDEHIVAWMWNHENGVVRVLLKFVMDEVCVSPELKQTMKDTESKFSVLEQFGTPWIAGSKHQDFTMSPAEGREKLNEALMEFRTNLLEGIDDMGTEIKRRKASCRKEAARKKKIESDKNIIRSVMNDLLNAVEKRHTGTVQGGRGSSQESDGDVASKKSLQESEDSISESWMQNFNKRFKLEKAADLLLMYARTSTFFTLNAYQPLKSSPIEVYARELGNAVPRSAIDLPKKEDPRTACDSASDRDDDAKGHSHPMDVDTTSKTQKKSKSRLCEPDDIISEVAVAYQGDYVLSQLLQWYNAGIDQKPGLPDLLGCVLLPSMDGIWSIDGTQGSSSRTDRATGYKSIIRVRLLDWLKDPLKRGSPWPDDLRRAFVDKSDDKPIADGSNQWMPLGSPILDFLVTGDDFSINAILHEMGSQDSGGASNDPSGLLSSIDHGRPAQAVSNWVQCENPACMKWRKVPWHVDIDTLPETFFCKDNVWNPNSASCDVPEDEWNEATDGVVDADGSGPIAAPVLESEEPIPPRREDSSPSCKIADFRLGARFDVLRSGKEKFTVGVVVKVKVEGGRRNAKFHYLNHSIKYDEWLDMESPRVAPLHTKTPQPPKRKAPKVTTKKEKNTAYEGNHSIDEECDTTLVDVAQNGKSESSTQSMAGMAENLMNGQAMAIPKESTYEDPGSHVKDPQKSVASTPKKPPDVLKGKESSILKGRPNAVTDGSSPSYSPKQGSRSGESKKHKNCFKPTIPRKKVQPSQASDGSPSNGGLRIPRKARPSEDQGLTLLMQRGKEAIAQRQQSLHRVSGERLRESSVPSSKSHDHTMSPWDKEGASENKPLSSLSSGIASSHLFEKDDHRKYLHRPTPPSTSFQNYRDSENQDNQQQKSPLKKDIENHGGDHDIENHDGDHGGEYAGRRMNTSGDDNFIISRRESPQRRKLEYEDDYDRDHRMGGQSDDGPRSNSRGDRKAARHDDYDDRRKDGRYDDERVNYRYQDSRRSDGDCDSRTRRSDDRKCNSFKDSPSNRNQPYEQGDRYRHKDENSKGHQNPSAEGSYDDDYQRKQRYNDEYERPRRSEYDHNERYEGSRDDRHYASRRDNDYDSRKYDRKYDRDYHRKRPRDERDYDRDYNRDFHRSTTRDDYYHHEKPRPSSDEFGPNESPKDGKYAGRDWSQRR